MNDVIVIGVDHGYAAMKTVHFSFPTGLVEYEHEPYTQKDVLECGGRYYVVGSGRQPLQRDKTQTEDYYLLTLAAIAKELEHRGAEHTASIHLAAGLPLTSFGRDKKSFRSYLYRDGSAIPFRYEGQDYTITIQEVSLFPQGYAAVLTQTELLDEPSVIVADIGGWTVDLMRLDNRIPNAASCRSLELGMIRCVDEISEQVRRLFGLSMTTAQIESALRGSSGGMDERIATPRLENPRVKIEGGSVGIAGAQTGIYPVASPGGWQLIGRTPVKLYDADREKPVLLEAGQYIRFRSVSEDEYYEIEKQAESGKYSCAVYEKEA